MKNIDKFVIFFTILIFSLISYAILLNPLESQKINEFLLRNASYLPGRPVPKDISCHLDYEMGFDAIYCTRDTPEVKIFLYIRNAKIVYTYFYLTDSVSLGEIKQSLGLWQRHIHFGRNHYWHWDKFYVYAYSRTKVSLFTPIRSLTLTL